MSLWLDSRPLHGRRQGGSGERLLQGKMYTRGGSLREKQKRREKEEEEEEETKTEP